MDGGKTWRLIDGEYMLGLHLVQSLPQGDCISLVMDLGQRDKRPLLTPVSIRSVSLSPNAETLEHTRVELALRTGRSPVYEPARWSGWPTASAAVPRENRYLRWKATLLSSDPLQSPRLRSVIVEAKVDCPRAPDWTNALQVVSFHNEEIRYKSLPSEYESPLHPHPVALRQNYQLDELVSGAASETEQLVKLRLISLDALRTQHQTAAQIVLGCGADHLFTLQANQEGLLQTAQPLCRSPFFLRTQPSGPSAPPRLSRRAAAAAKSGTG